MELTYIVKVITYLFALAIVFVGMFFFTLIIFSIIAFLPVPNALRGFFIVAIVAFVGYKRLALISFFSSLKKELLE